jgi:hypothetical protein
MSYEPGISALIAYKSGSGPSAVVTETTDGDTAATLGAIQSGPTIIGYTNDPDILQDLGNDVGFSGGSYIAAYTKRGMPKPQVTVRLIPGAIALFQKAFRASGALPYVDIYYAKNGAASKVIRCCKVNSGGVNINIAEASELVIDMQFWGIATQTAGPVLTATPSTVAAFGTPLFAHNVQRFLIGATDYRPYLGQLQIQFNHNLRRAGQRPDWGDDEPLSRTAYDLIEQTSQYNANLSLLQDVPTALWNAAALSQNWSDITIPIADTPVGGANVLDLTMVSPIPTAIQKNTVELNELQTYGIPLKFRDLALSTSRS